MNFGYNLNDMAYTLALTERPAVAVGAPVKRLVESLFLTLDNTDKSAGDPLADEIFAPDVVMDSHARIQGSEGTWCLKFLMHADRIASSNPQKQGQCLDNHQESPS